ncbi:MAG: 50S ribosomal protein L10 [Marinilabiliaceae bacterium]|nr:50S ribosomal protein L10 [Marinilabiliaceae bacterium]
MRKEDKSALISELAASISEYSHFYVTDTAGLNAEMTSNLRRVCFNEGVKLLVVKNTLFKKALEQSEGNYEELYNTLKGTSAIFFSNTGNLPARLIKDFRKGKDKPQLKSAYVQECVYVGEDQLDVLRTIKSKEELIGDIVALLQSPAKNVVSALQSGGGTIHGLLKTLGERNN